MTAKLKDSGTFGTYGPLPAAFSSAAYGRYIPSQPDQDARFYRHLRRWRFDTLTDSSAEKIVENSDFQSIVRMGESVLPLIISELRKRPDFLVVAMALITGENPVRPQQLGDISAMTQAWIDWYDYQR